MYVHAYVHPRNFICMHALVRVDLFIKALKPNVLKIWTLYIGESDDAIQDVCVQQSP
jgi:hypothetical protein